MITRLYVINDKLARESGPIFQCKNDQVAYRQYSLQISEMKNIKLDDFELVCIGEYNNENLQLQLGITIVIDEQWILFLETCPTEGNIEDRYSEFLQYQKAQQLGENNV